MFCSTRFAIRLQQQSQLNGVCFSDGIRCPVRDHFETPIMARCRWSLTNVQQNPPYLAVGILDQIVEMTECRFFATKTGVFVGAGEFSEQQVVFCVKIRTVHRHERGAISQTV